MACEECEACDMGCAAAASVRINELEHELDEALAYILETHNVTPVYRCRCRFCESAESKGLKPSIGGAAREAGGGK